MGKMLVEPAEVKCRLQHGVKADSNMELACRTAKVVAGLMGGLRERGQRAGGRTPRRLAGARVRGSTQAAPEGPEGPVPGLAAV